MCEDFAPRNGAARVSEERGANRTLEKAGRGQQEARELCEDFAPRNGAARVSEERGANRALEKLAAGPLCLPEDLQVCPAGPSHFRRAKPGPAA